MQRRQIVPLPKTLWKSRGFYRLIDSIVTIADVKRGKGFPDIYLKAAENLGLDSGDCIVFEDILVGVRAAKDGGFLTYGIYDERSAADTKKSKLPQTALFTVLTKCSRIDYTHRQTH